MPKHGLEALTRKTRIRLIESDPPLFQGGGGTTATSYQIKTVTNLGNTPIVVLTGNRTDFSVIGNSDGSLDIQNITGNCSSVHTTSADRVVFHNATSNSYSNWTANDTQGDACKIAEIIGTAFGRGYLGVSSHVRLASMIPLLIW